MSTFDKVFYGALAAIVIGVWSVFLKKYFAKREANLTPEQLQKRYEKSDKFYTKVTKIPLLGHELENIRIRYYITNYDKEYVLRYKSVKTFLMSWGISLLLYSLLIYIYRGDLYIILAMILLCMYFKGMIIDRQIGDDTGALEDLLEFCNIFKAEYHRTENPLTALDSAVNKASGVMVVHGKKMAEAMESELNLQMYYQDCPIKYMKMLVGMINITAEYGDKKIKEESLMMRNINYLMIDIFDELEKRDQIRYNLQNTTTFAVIPMLIPNLISGWMLKSFPQSMFFYGSSLNFIARLIVIIVAMVCFIILRQYGDFSSKATEVKLKKLRWEDWMFKFKPLKFVVDKITPQKETKRYHELVTLIEESGSNLIVEWLQLRKVLLFVAGILFCSCAVFTVIHQESQVVFTGSAYKFRKMDSDMIILRNESITINAFDREVLEEVKDKTGGKLVIDTANLITILESKGILEDDQKEIVAERIQSKIQYAMSRQFRCYHLIAIIIIGILFSFIPETTLKIYRSLRKFEMEQEVFQMYMIIVLLMHQDRMSIEIILEWLTRFSVVFRQPFVKCMNNLNFGANIAFEELKEDVKYKPVQALVDNFMMTDTLPISKSFENLETEREFNLRERHKSTERLVAERKQKSETLAMLSSYTLVFIYLVGPMVWTSFIEAVKLMATVE